jgi:hypothetical protein
MLAHIFQLKRNHPTKIAQGLKFSLKKTFFHRRMDNCCNLGQIQTKSSISDVSLNQDEFR